MALSTEHAIVLVTIDSERGILEQGFSRGFQADFEWLFRVDHSLGQCDWLKTGFYLPVQLEVAISGEVELVGFEPCASCFVAANAFQNAPRLAKSGGVSGSAIQLVAAREGAAVEKDAARRILAEKIASDLEHDAHREFVLLSGILDICGREKCRANVVLVDYRAATLGCEGATERTFSRPRKARHQNQHVVEDSLGSSRESALSSHEAALSVECPASIAEGYWESPVAT